MCNIIELSEILRVPIILFKVPIFVFVSVLVLIYKDLSSIIVDAQLFLYSPLILLENSGFSIIEC